jgi:hypothetical protein
MMNSILLLLLGFFGGGFGIALFFLFLYFRYPQNLEKIASHIAAILSYIFKRFQYYAIKGETEAKINGFITTLDSKLDVDLPYISIRWVAKEGEKEEIIHDDFESIIVMKDRNHTNKNFVHASYFFVSEVFLKDSKRHLSKHLGLSLDLFTTQEILKKESAAAAEQFSSNYIFPEVEKSDDVRAYLKQFTLIEGYGIFFPVLIQELSILGRKVFLEKKSQEILDEIKSLIDFLESWSVRKVGEEIKETFMGSYMKCAIKIVASHFSREANSVENQKDRVLQAVNQGCENIYLIGRIDDNNKDFMDSVSSLVISKNKNLEIKKNLSYKALMKGADGKNKTVHDYFIHVHNPKAVRHLISE